MLLLIFLFLRQFSPCISGLLGTCYVEWASLEQTHKQINHFIPLHIQANPDNYFSFFPPIRTIAVLGYGLVDLANMADWYAAVGLRPCDCVCHISGEAGVCGLVAMDKETLQLPVPLTSNLPVVPGT